MPGLGGCLLPGGAWSRRGVCLLWGVSAPGGSVAAPGGEGAVSQYALRQTPLTPCGQTHTCETITLAQLRCGR